MVLPQDSQVDAAGVAYGLMILPQAIPFRLPESLFSFSPCGFFFRSVSVPRLRAENFIAQFCIEMTEKEDDPGRFAVSR
jgi:hypothetical protein